MKIAMQSSVSAGLLLALSGTWSLAAPAPAEKGPREIALLKGHKSSVRALAFSPDGKMLVSGAFCDGTIRLWDPVSGRNLALLRHTESVPTGAWAVAFSPDGKIVASGCGKTIKLWDAVSGKNLATFEGHQRDVLSLAFSPDGKTLASGGLDATARLWDLKTKKELSSRELPCRFTEVAYDEANKPLIAGPHKADSKSFSLWRMDPEVPAITCEGHHRKSSVGCLAFSGKGKTAASTDTFYPTVRLWDVATGKNTVTFEHPSGQTILSLTLNSDCKLLAFAYSTDSRKNPDHGGGVCLLGVPSGKVLALLKRPSGHCAAVAFSPDGRLLAADWGGDIKVWKLRPRKIADE